MSGNGRAACKAKEILCFFHHICYENEEIEEDMQTDSLTPKMNRYKMPDASNEVNIYPNPANTWLMIEAATPLKEIAFYDLSGRLALIAQISENTHADVNISDLHKGMYMVRIVTDAGIFWKRLIKN